MKYLLVGVNAKYSHSNLAIRSLRQNCGSKDVEIAEYTINDNKEKVLADIFLKQPDVICFSCYIWNIEFIKEVAASARLVMPCSVIIAGGPEVSYDATQFLTDNQCFNAVMRGEGEWIFAKIVKTNACFDDIFGVTYRKDNKIIENKTDNAEKDFNDIIFPYTEEDIQELKNKMVYYESSRGCPYNCSYCLSSTVKGVRFRDIDTVKRELEFFIQHDVRLVKFVDRTFNADKQRALEIWKFAAEKSLNTKFHFEIAADILTDEMIEFLKTVPSGLFQFEVGIQSTNLKTLTAVDRNNNLTEIMENVKKLVGLGNIHIHTDLIAGLPYEDLDSFKNSFNQVFELGAQMLQLGFLKLLKGSKIRELAAEHGYKHDSKAVYEVFENNYISYKELILLKGIEEMLESYYNSGMFDNSLPGVIKEFKTPFDFFERLWDFYKSNNYNLRPVSKRELYDILYDFCECEKIENKVYENIKFDFIKNNRGVSFNKRYNQKPDKEFLKWRHSFLTDENIAKYLPQYIGQHPQDILKNVHFEKFEKNVKDDVQGECIVIFDYLYKKEVIIGGHTNNYARI